MLAWLNRSRKSRGGQVGLALQDGGIALVHVTGSGMQAEVRHAELLRGDPAALPRLLSQRVRSLGLHGLPCVLLPSAADYQLLLVTRPAVDEAELASAMRWQIRDQVSQAPESLVVDAWPLPDEIWRGRQAMAYCAAMSKARMNELAALAGNSGLKLQAIDIQEMSLRNLGLLAGESPRPRAMLQLHEQSALIGVLQGDMLLMARRIDTGIDNRGTDSAVLALEIQRSFDYFERQMTRGAVGDLQVLPSRLSGSLLYSDLHDRLGLKVQELKIPQLHAAAMQQLDAAGRIACLPALGAALRQEAS